MVMENYKYGKILYNLILILPFLLNQTHTRIIYLVLRRENTLAAAWAILDIFQIVKGYVANKLSFLVQLLSVKLFGFHSDLTKNTK